MPSIYRVETSPNNRAGCQNVECKKSGIKLQKGELRFGTFVTIMEHQSWRWKHWGCVTPQQISNLKDSTEGDLERYLDGYEDLGEDEQAKVAKAIEDGHVSDDDWNGDVECNREGQKGFRTPASKKKARDQAKAEKEGADDGDQSPSQSSKQRKKRSHADEEGDVEIHEKPAPKRAKQASKRGKKAKAEDDSANEPESKPSSKRVKKIKAEDNSANVLGPKPTSKRAKKVKAEDGSADESELKPKSKKGRKEAIEPKVADKSVATIKAEASADDNIAPPPAKKQRAARKAAPKKIKSENVESDEDGPLPSMDGDDADFDAQDGDSDDAVVKKTPKSSKARKPSVKEIPNQTPPIQKSKAKQKRKRTADQDG